MQVARQSHMTAGLKALLLCLSFIITLFALLYKLASYAYTMHHFTTLSLVAGSVSSVLGQWRPSWMSGSTSFVPGASTVTGSSPASPTTSSSSGNGATYTNPILQQNGADPWVVQHDGHYYMTYTTSDNVTILRSSVLTFVIDHFLVSGTNTAQ